MTTTNKTFITIEPHCLQLPYTSLRLQRRSLLDKLIISIEDHGQLVPVVVVPQETNRWVLMDGYLRLNALQRLGRDTIDAEVWNCDCAQALIRLLTEHQSRIWERFEEALLLQELHLRHGLSQGNLADQIGRDKSWVNRRLLLLESLSEPMLQAIIQGKLSLWVATRIVVPLARANGRQGQYLLDYLLKNPHSTREVQFFYHHYQQANRQQRAYMIHDPDLFFKAQKLLAVEKRNISLKSGPEGQWYKQLNGVKNALTVLISLAPSLFTFYQDSQEQRTLIKNFNEVNTQFDVLTNTMRSFTNAQKRHETNHC